MSAPSRGFVGSQVFGTIGVAVGGDDPAGFGAAAMHQYVDVPSAGTIYARVRSDDPSFPNPQVALGAWTSAEAAAMDFGQLSTPVEFTGYGGFVQGQLQVAAGDRVLIVVAGVDPAKATLRHWLGWMPQLGAPSFLRTRTGYQKSAGWLYLSSGYDYDNSALWYRRAGVTAWTLYTGPVNLGAVSVQAMRTAEGWVESPVVSADI